MPYTMEQFTDGLPYALKDNNTGKIVWATLYTFLCLLPVSLPRSLKSLRFTSLVSFVISVFMVLTIFSLCFKEKAGVDTHGFKERIEYAYQDTEITMIGIFNSLPLIIFSYMY